MSARVGAAMTIVMLLAMLMGALFLWIWWEQRQWVVSRAVDRGACASTRHLHLAAPTPRAARELFAADLSCRRQVIAMLRVATNFTCSARDDLTVCTHPLNAPDSSTFVRAVVTGNHVLLVTIPS